MTLPFWKYQALGNDYLVVEEQWRDVLQPAVVRRICERHWGLGADGILVHREASDGVRPRVAILNPDGSEAEKSGNGLRIFARYLWDRGLVADAPFVVETLGGIVTCQVLGGGALAMVDMGPVSFESRRIPVHGPEREVLNEPIFVGNESLTFSAASVGNPHCVVMCPNPCETLARRLGPLLETHPLFPNRTNVQLARVVDRRRIRLEIWERGAGYTLASGSSACAAASVLHRLNLCDGEVDVEMPGGSLHIEIAPDFSNVRLRGPVVKIAEGGIALECWEGE